eukprot:5059267-Pleurochrysis_carterae.AAC.1
MKALPWSAVKQLICAKSVRSATSAGSVPTRLRAVLDLQKRHARRCAARRCVCFAPWSPARLASPARERRRTAAARTRRMPQMTSLPNRQTELSA